MCLWLLTACLGLLPANPSQNTIVVIQGVPTPILQPTTAATTTTTTTTTARPPTPVPTMTPTMTPTMVSTSSPPPPTMTTVTVAPPPPGSMSPMNSTTVTPQPTSPGNTPMPPPIGNNTAAPTTMITILTTNPTGPSNPSPPTTMPSMTTASTNRPSTGGSFLPVLLCDNPDVICVFNPDDNTTGSFVIDPRLGSTPAALQVPPISGYSASVPSFDTAVKFPRERRSAPNFFKNKNVKNIQHVKMDHGHIRNKRQSCRCVPTGTCIKTGTSMGAGMIDIRIVTPAAVCPAGQEYCCGNTINSNVIACGTAQTVPSPAVVPATGQANFGEYPWQALILTKQNDYIAGGVLINQLNILTVTHRLSTYIVAGAAPNVKVRLGEWDAAGVYEPIPFQEYTVQKVFTHPSFNPNTLQYDIAVIRLSSAVPLTPMNGSAATINRACLPPTSTSTYVGQRCWVSGWGKDMFGLQGQYQQILKEVDVPIVASATCQTQMQTARLGATFVLDTTSFICAGGEANKDSCTGDGGSGLVCQVNGQWVVIGLVAWGLGCAAANVPAAYVNVAAFLPWIQQQVAAA